MDDGEVIEVFVDEGSGAVFGPSLSLERSALRLDGWWPVAYRLSDRSFVVRDEPAPTESTALADVAAALAAKGLIEVGRDLPAIALLTYTKLDIGYSPWVLWSTDLATGEADLNSRATEETSLESGWATGTSAEPNTTDHARGARLLAGTPSRIVLTVGVSDEWTTALSEGLDDCRFEHRAFDEIDPGDCGSFLPTLVLIDATGPTGSAFLAELQAEHGVSAPVVAITTNGDMRAGADATVDPGVAGRAECSRIGMTG